MKRAGISLILAVMACFAVYGQSESTKNARIPLAEHPRPDFQRVQWQNLNGEWDFSLDPNNIGLKEDWQAGKTAFTQKITVPFPWGSALSGVKDAADIGWYKRTIRIPEAWKGQRIYLVIGACDWTTQGWLDQKEIGQFRGGYTPFEFELTPVVRFGEDQTLILRVDDTKHPFKLEGKQGYGAAKGIWQTPYLEARSPIFVQKLHFTPNLDTSSVAVKAWFSDIFPKNGTFKIQLKNSTEAVEIPIKAGEKEVSASIVLKEPRKWTLEDPFLYEVQASLQAEGAEPDKVDSYFGFRKISVVNLPQGGYPYIALNNRPVYLQLALDQSYHEGGFYTFPSDAFMREEILRARKIGLNALRLHVKIDVPRKLYWADRLGILIMADVPNSWGSPDAEMRKETETALRGMIDRDFNHPSIFSWVVFNETWGLFTNKKYAPETQEWVASMYRLAKQLDPSRLVEDNSPCNNDHVVTDINSWHSYLPGYAWKGHLDQVTRDTYPGSTWNYIGGHKQGNQPLLNSECGNVWGYEGSTGDVDWSWDYHIMMNQFRSHPKICGWLYTELHDVINEWNGYYRFDRSEKETGLSAFASGMTLRDLHGPYYIAPGTDLCQKVEPKQKVEIPLWASFMTDTAPAKQLKLRVQVTGYDSLGVNHDLNQFVVPIQFQSWFSQSIQPVTVEMPAESGLVIVSFYLEDSSGNILHRNFTTFTVTTGQTARKEVIQRKGVKMGVVRFAPQTFTRAEWTVKQWNVLDGLKVNGAGAGYFEYRIPWPEELNQAQVSGLEFRAELSAKQLFGKDKKQAGKQEGDFMLGKGTHDPSLNPNAYPMTDTITYPSSVRIRVAGESVGVFDLPDDPADHRGVLSWYSQKRDRHLQEAGSYGYLINATVSESAIAKAKQAGEIVIRLEVDDSNPGGLAIYGEKFGRYPIDPTLVFHLK